MDINRKTAMDTLVDIERKQAYSNIALNEYIKKNNADTPALVRELVYGVLKKKRYIDYILSQLISTPLEKVNVTTLQILRMGVYQLLFMGSVPDYAAVNESMVLAKKYTHGQSGFVNGVLRNVGRNKDKFLSDEMTASVDKAIYYSYSDWIVEMWENEYGAEFTEALLRAGNETPKLCIRVNELKISVDHLKEMLTSEGFNVEKGRFVNNALYVKGSHLLETSYYKEGYFTIQDESSMLAAKWLDPTPGEFVIDVCSAPGGKTLALAEYMNNEGKILAGDHYPHKLQIIEAGAKRLGIDIVETVLWDAAKVNRTLTRMADKVLVDVPCSGLGVIRRKPEIKYLKENPDLTGLPELQKRILQASSTYLKPGGTMIYSTCTISQKENNDVVNAFVRRNEDFEIIDMKQLHPNVEDTDGFFICKMKRMENL